MKMNTAVQVGLLGKFPSAHTTNILQYSRTVSSRRVISAQSTSRKLFGAPEAGEIDKLFENFNDESKKYLEDKYGYITSKDEKSSSTSSACHHPNLIELERTEYENKMKNSKITSKFHNFNYFFFLKVKIFPAKKFIFGKFSKFQKSTNHDIIK